MANNQQSPKYSPNALSSPALGGPNKFTQSSPVYMPNGIGAQNAPYGSLPGQSNAKSPAYSPTQSFKQVNTPGGRIGPSPIGP